MTSNREYSIGSIYSIAMTTVVVCNTIHNIISYKIKLGGGGREH